MRHFPFERLQNVFIFAEDLFKLEENPAAKIVRCVPRLTEDGPILFRINILYIQYIVLSHCSCCHLALIPSCPCTGPCCHNAKCYTVAPLLCCCPYDHFVVPLVIYLSLLLYHGLPPFIIYFHLGLAPCHIARCCCF